LLCISWNNKKRFDTVESPGLEHESRAGCCSYGSEPSSAIEYGENVNQIIEC